MFRVVIILFVLSGLMSCRSGNRAGHKVENAKWIAYEQLPDSMKIIPGVHGNGNRLGEKGRKRSVVPMFRKEFRVKEELESASISITGLGHYELYLNGRKIGGRFLSPGWTNYEKHVLYNTYDITEYLKEGDNAIGAIVGNGFFNINRERYRKLVIAYGYPMLKFNIVLTYRDGSVSFVNSGEQCKVTPSPVTFSSIYGGEDYDARHEQKGWSMPGFDDSSWKQAIVISDTLGRLVPETDHPLKVMQEFEVKDTLVSKTGRTIYDFGQNASGIVAIKVKGNRGAKVVIKPAELLDDERNISQRGSGGPFELSYTLKGSGVEAWQPKFTYYGFRYADVEIVEPENAAGKTKLVDIRMLHTRNSSPAAGHFESSDTLFNRIFDLINWGIRSNMASVLTDCPHREKLGWLEQTYLIGPSIHYNYNTLELYRKIVVDMMDAQLDNGLVPDIAPEYVPFEGGFRDSPEWGSASVIIPWQLYKWYGDEETLKKAYPMMKKYVEYLQGRSKDNILNYGLGDWFDLGPKRPGVAQLTPVSLTATAIYYYDVTILAEVAKLLDKKDDSRHYLKLSDAIRISFLNEFFDERTGVCSTGSQTAYAMPLFVGLIPEEYHEKVLNNLVNSIKKNDYALTAGDIGYRFLVGVLSKYGKSEVLYRMNNRTDRPGYGYQLKKGATALTESWAALPFVSNNHMMLGHLMSWFYSGLGGIRQEEGSVAFKNIVIAPIPVGKIRHVKSFYHSASGIIISNWHIEDEGFVMQIAIPENTTARIVIPENIKYKKVKVFDKMSGKKVKVNLKDDAFKLPAGQYRIDVLKKK